MMRRTPVWRTYRTMPGPMRRTHHGMMTVIEAGAVSGAESRTGTVARTWAKTRLRGPVVNRRSRIMLGRTCRFVCRTVGTAV